MANPPVFTATDAALIAALPGLLALSRLVPEPGWPALCRRLAPLAEPAYVPRRARTARDIAAVLDADAPRAVLRALAAEKLLAMMRILRGLPPAAEAPRIALEGRERIESARTRGAGIVFWIAAFVHADLIAKAALARAGAAPRHLSVPGHGLSPSRFGIAALNPLQLRVEDRCLAGRVFLDPARPGGALRPLREALAKGVPVSIMAARPRPGGSRVPARFLNGRLDVAPGAAVLAARTGAALLPVVALRTAPAAYCVRIGGDLGGDGAPVETLVQRFADHQAAAVRAHPEQWRGWFQF